MLTVIRHSRSAAFEAALPVASAPVDGRSRWPDVASDPNDPAALARRAAALRAAWRPSIRNRVAFIEDRCRGRKVLDIGCVAHGIERIDSPDWLHRRIATVASACIGVDILEDEVAHLVGLGFDAVAHDLGDGLGPLDSRSPFDVIVAGELIEHVPSLAMLFETASAGLAPGGELIVTTPNPYSPSRVRAGQRGIVWENADHIMYAFPSGIAELAERHGLALTEAATVAEQPFRYRSLREIAKQIRRVVRGRHYVCVGYSTLGDSAIRRVGPTLLRRWAQRVATRRNRFVGETFVYVIKQPAE